MSNIIEIAVPPIGGAEHVVVAEFLVAAGDTVESDQSLVTLESDKASMEVPAPASGTVVALQATPGDEVSEGSVILTLRSEGTAQAGADTAPSDTSSDSAASMPPAPQAAPAAAPGIAEPDTAFPSPPPPPRVEPPAPGRPVEPRSAAEMPYASPGVRRLAREMSVDLTTVSGTGRNGRIGEADVRRASAAGAASAPPTAGVLPPMPAVDFAEFGSVESERLTRINRLTGTSVHRSWLHVPHVTQFDEADITELEAFRQAHKTEAAERGVKLTFVSFLLAAAAAALREFPRFNSSLSEDGSEVILKHYINIGVAVDTPQGLVVPVVRGVGGKRLFEIAADLLDLSSRAREGKLLPGDFRGGTFTISSLGGVGGTAFTPIVNAPEVAILGASRARMQPVWNGTEFAPRLMLPLSLSYDHRVIDGAAAARFTTRLGQFLSDIRGLLL